MVASNGVRHGCKGLALAWLLGLCPGLPGAALPAACPPVAAVQDPATEDLERLRAMLSVRGPDGREARETAIERLMVLPRPDAHALLHERLAGRDDADGLRLAIVTSLQRHFLLAPAAQFGGAAGEVRETLLRQYLLALAPLWRPTGADEAAVDALAQAARLALQRMPWPELDVVARALLAMGDAALAVDVMRCLADMQQTAFATTIAAQLEAADAAVRAGAEQSLQLLTCNEVPIRTKAQFADWWAANGNVRYLDLVERAARRFSAPNERMKEEISRLRIDAAREVVRAHVTRTPGVDWSAVQGRVVVEDGAVLDACLELLQQALPAVGDDASPARQLFARALIQRFRSEPENKMRRRARLLEVAAYLGRADDSEMAKDLIALLLAQLDVADGEARIAALRGLRRFPSGEARARLVAYGRRLLADRPIAREQLVAILATLSSRAAPRWQAPSATDVDRADWLALVAAACRTEEALELREPALALAQTLDARDQRVPEVFELLLDLARDTTLGVKYRTTCAIHLQGWRNDANLAEQWLAAQHELLRDTTAELRQQAAESLATLTESVAEARSGWISATITAVRDRLLVETEPVVLRALVACLEDCGREPLMAEKAIGGIGYVLSMLGNPVPQEQQFRADPLLQALATIGADPRVDRGQWLAACQHLLDHKRRQSLRLVLSNHAAVELGKDVLNSEPGIALGARQAMNLILETGALKPARETWSSSDELLREAKDVRTAFGALEALPEKDRPDRAALRVLRLEVELLHGKPQDVVQRATAWLANGNGTRVPMTEEERNRVRLLAAEGQLALGRPEAARKLVDERTGDAVDDASVRDLEIRIARALVATDLAGAVDILGRVLRRTSSDDPVFRSRLVEWMQNRIRLDPALRADTLATAAQYEAMFASADCPAELRAAFEGLRSSR